MAPQSALRVDGLHFSFKGREVLRGVTFDVRPGEIFGLLGPNGGGKTTLFRIVTTFLYGWAGRVEVFGADLLGDPDAVRRAIGVVFQTPSTDKKLTVLENLTHQGHLYGLRGAALSSRIADLLARFGIADRADERVEKLSGGLRRRAELAKGILHRPRLLILDEPTAGLDPGARRDFWRELERERKESGTTIVFTTHLMEEADRCDRVAILDAGVIVALDAPAALKATLGGDVVTIQADDPDGLRGDVEAKLGVKAQVFDGSVRIERERGHEVVLGLAEAFGGRVRSITLGKPTLEDVFIHRTGRRFE